MDENPYKSPQSHTEAKVPWTGPEKVRQVAKYQKGVLVGVLGYPALVMTAIPAPRIVQDLLLGISILLALVAVVYVTLMIRCMYGILLGILLGVLTFVPCLGTLVLLRANAMATSYLRKHGVEVGFFGADLSDFSD